MSTSPDAPLPRRKPPVLRPSFTLALLYLAGFFLLFSLLLILPELLPVLNRVPPGPEQQRLAEERQQQQQLLEAADAASKLIPAIAGAEQQAAA